MLEKYRCQRNDVDKITPAQMIAIFYLKLHSFKSVAKSTCEKLLELVEKTMVKYVYSFSTVNILMILIISSEIHF
jgi:hypothetical protein